MNGNCLALSLLYLGTSLQPTDNTCFQTGGFYSPTIDIAADLAIVYGSGPDFSQRALPWKERGYEIALMTGIAWGDYGAYFGTAENLKKEEIQTRKNGSLFMHDPHGTTGYNVPTPTYVEFLKEYIKPALDAGVSAVFLEEPEFWAKSGWSKAFQEEWERFYGEPWQPPDSSVDSQYKASRLKYELYYRAIKTLGEYIKEYSKKTNSTIECHVATHSLLNYAHWGIVSPESYATEIPELDGLVAQVWTGTTRTPNIYRGVKKERTFETAFLEYGQMAYVAKSTNKKMWFLHDPVEDNPNRSWEDYRRNYKCTVVASLLWPEVYKYEVMPWPSRIFENKYRLTDASPSDSPKQTIPQEYATTVLTILNALSDMGQKEIQRDTGSSQIGIIVSDTMMFQRAEPAPSDPDLGAFFALALPLLNMGIPVVPVSLECVTRPGALDDFRILFLTYEHQKPAKPAYHEALNDWVRAGGALILIDDGQDSYHNVKEWWNNYGKTDKKAYEDLLQRLGVRPEQAATGQKISKGYFRFLEESPSALQNRQDGPECVQAWLREAAQFLDMNVKTQNYLKVQRGPYVVAAVLEETNESRSPLILEGEYVDLWELDLPIVTRVKLEPGDKALLYDLSFIKRSGTEAKVIAAGARVREEKCKKGSLSFITRGPTDTRGVVRAFIPKEPKEVVTEPVTDVSQSFDPKSCTLLLKFPNSADNLHFVVRW
ncbi:MAG TPA: hypothetical protein PKY35_11900 [Candidatus Hydrogenedentes bacterium]|nr:hypothetical protein [Candidatus Hydrogenedentota bacterium]HOL77721.1 hypothetical protein [Candidatus Hydrogenedentota bacterium]HPO86844.1 hypothetical protein [Candidatus Hydrogenedentota bacterium]